MDAALFVGCGGEDDSADDGGGHEVGDTYTLDLGDGVKMEFFWIPPGTFVMGARDREEDHYDERPQHSVTIGKGFWMGKYEVTLEQWGKVMRYKADFIPLVDGLEFGQPQDGPILNDLT